VKGFVSLQFLNLRESIGLLGRRISQIFLLFIVYLDTVKNSEYKTSNIKIADYNEIEIMMKQVVVALFEVPKFAWNDGGGSRKDHSHHRLYPRSDSKREASEYKSDILLQMLTKKSLAGEKEITLCKISCYISLRSLISYP
jgi:hypothetical protein